MLILALHWSALVECMDWVSCWSWTYSAYVCNDYCCECVWIWLCYYWRSKHKFKGSLMSDIIIHYHHVLFKYTTIWRWRRCIDLCLLLNVRNGCCFGPGRTARTFAMLCVWLGFVIDVRCNGIYEATSCNFNLIRHFAFRMHYIWVQ